MSAKRDENHDDLRQPTPHVMGRTSKTRRRKQNRHSQPQQQTKATQLAQNNTAKNKAKSQAVIARAKRQALDFLSTVRWRHLADGFTTVVND